jgi:hypothetical protein
MSGSKTTPSWIVKACDPSGTGQVLLALHPEPAETMVRQRRRAVLGQFFGLIQQSEVLLNPVAAYRGLMRPLNFPGHDDDVIAYITRPSFTYTFSDDGGLVRYQAPRNCVFVAFVCFAQDVLTDLHNNPANASAGGGVLDWEWTEADPTVPYLPVDYQTRYRSTLWTR